MTKRKTRITEHRGIEEVGDRRPHATNAREGATPPPTYSLPTGQRGILIDLQNKARAATAADDPAVVDDLLQALITFLDTELKPQPDAGEGDPTMRNQQTASGQPQQVRTPQQPQQEARRALPAEVRARALSTIRDVEARAHQRSFVEVDDLLLIPEREWQPFLERLTNLRPAAARRTEQATSAIEHFETYCGGVRRDLELYESAAGRPLGAVAYARTTLRVDEVPRLVEHATTPGEQGAPTGGELIGRFGPATSHDREHEVALVEAQRGRTLNAAEYFTRLNPRALS